MNTIKELIKEYEELEKSEKGEEEEDSDVES